VESQTATGVLVVQEPLELEIDIETLVVRRERPSRSEG
jgi:hypothetical protein